MPSLRDRIFHRGGQQIKEDSPTEVTIADAAVRTRHSAQESEDRQSKGIDIDMIDPEEITKELEQLAHYTAFIKVNKLIKTDEFHTYIASVDEQVVRDRPWAIATLGYLNKVWPTIWMTPWEADTTKLRVRTGFHDIRKSMTYQEKREYGIVLRMVRDLCLARIEDMKEGHKALLLKVRREELGVHMTKGEKGGGK